MNLTQLILTLLSNNHGNYHDLRKKIRSFLSKQDTQINSAVIQSTLSRLKHRGILTKGKDNVWEITDEGRELISLKQKGLKKFFPKKSLKLKLKKEVLVLFDIPEKERYKRDWFRSELIGFGYEMIQQSVWYGPKLPKNFLQYLIENKIYEYVHIFNVKKELLKK